MLAGLCLVIFSVSCAPENLRSPEPDLTDPVELRVMTLNIELGGVKISFDKAVEAIRAAKADVVGIQEAEEVAESAPFTVRAADP